MNIIPSDLARLSTTEAAIFAGLAVFLIVGGVYVIWSAFDPVWVRNQVEGPPSFLTRLLGWMLWVCYPRLGL